MKEFLINNWYFVLFAVLFLAWQIARLTPSEKDDRIVKGIINLLTKILTMVPDNKKGGGKFKIDSIVDEKK